MEGERSTGLKKRLLAAVTWVVRLAVGGTFVFSGFVKSIDPWGTLYKFDDYLAALGIDLWPQIVLAAVFLLCAAEFLAGVFLVTGSFRRITPWFAALFMLVMLPLTFWIALKDPVDDCGCFGDALILSNWATFWKNVALTLGIVWLIYRNRKTGWLIRPALQWLGVVVSSIYILLIALYGYNVQPMLDFRPFKVGTELLSESDAEEPRFTFIYEKEGIRKSFSEEDELPDESDGWTFVDRVESESSVKSDKLEKSESSDFRLWTRDSEDVTEDVLDSEGDIMMILIPDVSEMSAAYIWKLNTLDDWSTRHDVRMIAVACGSESQLDEWEDLAMASYPIYTADDTQVKMLARGNPAVVWLKDGVVKWKGSLSIINGDNLEQNKSGYSKPEDFVIDHQRLLKNLSLIYIAVIAVLIFLSFTVRFSWIVNRLSGENIKPKNLKRQVVIDDVIDDGKAPRAESSSPGKAAPQKTGGPSHG